MLKILKSVLAMRLAVLPFPALTVAGGYLLHVRGFALGMPVMTAGFCFAAVTAVFLCCAAAVRLKPRLEAVLSAMLLEIVFWFLAVSALFWLVEDAISLEAGSYARAAVYAVVLTLAGYFAGGVMQYLQNDAGKIRSRVARIRLERKTAACAMDLASGAGSLKNSTRARRRRWRE
ncbi:MAG: hypothetical protein IJ523_07020 [Succinivibrionaceae bacterium]|nr:hypothetical protein [Succinivibrionaceae bacterium]